MITRHCIRCVLAFVGMLAGCDDRIASVGAFLPTNDAGSGDALTCVQASRTAALATVLPVTAATLLEDLPAELMLGQLVARKQFSDPMDTIPKGWSLGGGAYSSSLAEFGSAGHASNNGWHELLVTAKSDPTEGTTDRKFWGGELASPALFGHGIFLARVRSDGWQDVHSSFFFSNDKVSKTGTSLGWTGAVFEMTHDGKQQKLNSLFNDSASGKHDYKGIAKTIASKQEMLFGIVSLPGRVAFYVDGQLVDERQDADTLDSWEFHFTHWINNPAPRAYVSSATPVAYGIDFVAHYAVNVCP
jgi:hypothetical protein